MKSAGKMLCCLPFEHHVPIERRNQPISTVASLPSHVSYIVRVMRPNLKIHDQLTEVHTALAAVGATLAALFTHKTAAQRRETRTQATSILFLSRWRLLLVALLVLHWRWTLLVTTVLRLTAIKE